MLTGNRNHNTKELDIIKVSKELGLDANRLLEFCFGKSAEGSPNDSDKNRP